MNRSIHMNVKIDANDLSIFMIRHLYTKFTGIFGVFLSVFSLGILIGWWNHFGTMQRLILVFLALTFTVFQPMLLRLKSNKQLRAKAFQEPFVYDLDEDGITVSQGDLQETMEWEKVKKIVIQKHAVYIYMTAMSAFILPESKCEGKFNDVYELVKEKKNK